MEAISSYLPTVFKQISDSLHQHSTPVDTITYVNFTQMDLLNKTALVLLVAYERGFQVWDLSEPSSPALLASKRNPGVACIQHLPQGFLALSPLYETLEWPKNTLQLFSLFPLEQTSSIRASCSISHFLANESVIALALVDYEIEVYCSETLELKYSISAGRGGIGDFEIIMTLSSLHLAYSLSVLSEPKDNAEPSLTNVISNKVFSFAENGFNTMKNYIEQSGYLTAPYNYLGKVCIHQLNSGQAYCEFQAFTSSISYMKFSPSSRLLVVAHASGQYLHIYKIESSPKYTLVYKLTRGLTCASISDITISLDEAWVVVSSSRGTSHVYSIVPDCSSLNYNHPVFTRIKHAHFLDRQLYPKCHIQLVNKFRPGLEDQVEACPPELLTMCQSGVYTRHVLDANPVQLSANMLARPVAFKEKFPRNEG